MTSYRIVEEVKRRAPSPGSVRSTSISSGTSAAHHLRLEDAADDSVLRLMGWRDRSMLHRYGASAADERAQATHRRIGLGDRL